ncbi:MAG: hypothetical protein AAF721_08115 [Myxococcota bacterium]
MRHAIALGTLVALLGACPEDSDADDVASDTTAATPASSSGSTSEAPAADSSTSELPAASSSDGAVATGSGSGSSSATGSGSSDGPDDGVVTFDEVHPIFAEMCSPCHSGAGLGGHNVGGALATAHTDSQLPATACAGMTVGQCTLVRIQSGQMPMGFGCTGDPAQDVDMGGCTTQAQQDLIQQWIDDGELPPV